MKIEKTINKIKDETWKKGKYAQDYPKDFIVIPVLEANEIFQKGVEELEEDLK